MTVATIASLSAIYIGDKLSANCRFFDGGKDLLTANSKHWQLNSFIIDTSYCYKYRLCFIADFICQIYQKFIANVATLPINHKNTNVNNMYGDEIGGIDQCGDLM